MGQMSVALGIFARPGWLWLLIEAGDMLIDQLGSFRTWIGLVLFVGLLLTPKAQWLDRQLKTSRAKIVAFALAAWYVAALVWTAKGHIEGADNTLGQRATRIQELTTQNAALLMRPPEKDPNQTARIVQLEGQVAALIEKLAAYDTAEANRQRRLRAAQKIRQFVREGEQLSAEIRARDARPIERVDGWIEDVEVMLRHDLSESYVSRFRISAGIPLAPRMWANPPSPELNVALTRLDLRLARLSEFLGELDR